MKNKLQRWVLSYDKIDGKSIWFSEKTRKPIIGIDPPCASSLFINSDNELNRICNELEALGVKEIIYCERYTDKNGELILEEYVYTKEE